MDFDFSNINNLTLSQAVQAVIDQNRSLGYIPTRFIEITNGKSGEDLKRAVSSMVLKSELVEVIENSIKKYGNILTIEDLIANKNDGFELSTDVITIAKARSEYFSKIRKIFD